LAGAIGTARALLDRGASIVWFPEGRRSPTGDLLPFRPGVGVLLKDSRCLVVPTHVSGTYEAWPPKRSRPRAGGRLRVAFGQPVAVSELAAEGRGETDELRIVDALERRVAALAPGRGATDAAPSSGDASNEQTRGADPGCRPQKNEENCRDRAPHPFSSSGRRARLCRRAGTAFPPAALR